MANGTKTDDIQKDFEDQIAELRAQIADLAKAASTKTRKVADDANEKLEDVQGNVRRAASTVRHQGQAVAEAVRQNPGTATTVLSTAGLIGFIVGFAVGSCRDSSWRW